MNTPNVLSKCEHLFLRKQTQIMRWSHSPATKSWSKPWEASADMCFACLSKWTGLWNKMKHSVVSTEVMMFWTSLQKLIIAHWNFQPSEQYCVVFFCPDKRLRENLLRTWQVSILLLKFLSTHRVTALNFWRPIGWVIPTSLSDDIFHQNTRTMI